MIRIRESFGAKLLSALAGTVGLLLLVTYIVVRAETARQVEIAADRAVRNAGTLFEELNDLQRQQTDQLARPFTDGRRALALLEAAIEAADLAWVEDQVTYEMQLAGLSDVLVVFTDGYGEPILSMIGGATFRGGDPAVIGPVAAELLDGEELELRGYRVIEGRMYNVRTIYVESGSRPIGTITFGLPFAAEDVERIGSVGGVEVCFRVDRSCAVRTKGIEGGLMTAIAGVGSPDALRTRTGGAEWSIRSEPLIAGRPEQGDRVLAIPLDEVLAPFERIGNALLLGGGGALLLSMLFGAVISRNLTRPVRELVAATGRVAEGDYEAEVSVRTHDEIGTLANAFNDMTRGLLLRERYRSVLSKVVSQDVAEELMKGEVELGGENRDVSVIFADVRGFTSLTEGMEPQEVIRLLNECMEHLSRAVDVEGGVVDKFIGDAVMAVFGAPARQEDHARRAVSAAVRMRDGMQQFNALRAERGQHPIGLGIGINSGEAVAGNMGSTDRLNYTVLGATVNLASRLCSQASAGEILTTRSTRDRVLGRGGRVGRLHRPAWTNA